MIHGKYNTQGQQKRKKHIILIKGIDAYSWPVLKVLMVKLKYC